MLFICALLLLFGRQIHTKSEINTVWTSCGTTIINFQNNTKHLTWSHCKEICYRLLLCGYGDRTVVLYVNCSNIVL